MLYRDLPGLIATMESAPTRRARFRVSETDRHRGSSGQGSPRRPGGKEPHHCEATATPGNAAGGALGTISDRTRTATPTPVEPELAEAADETEDRD